MHEGQIAAEIPRDRATEERVMYAATGSADGGVADEHAPAAGPGASRG